MAHSFVKYNGANVRVHDADLTAVICLLVDAAQKNVKIDGKVRESVLRWANAARTWGPGCIDFDLDTVLPDRRTVNEFRELIGEARRALALFGEKIPGEYLNDRLGLSGVASRQALPVRLAEQVLSDLEKLLS
ncbi:hypothetical protein WMF18_31215 [Sorangium sp. So ce315]|uniref:hypothetical protein n=1 Tax=Sorangium sp. So ce315 TaxID=3133299 RepID=UPI003F60B105